MRLKEIKPGMVIHCKTLEEMKELSKHIHIPFNVDVVWKYGSDCINFESESFTTHCHLNHFVKNNYEITEFSDLIIPEITAEEVIEWFGDYYASNEFTKLFGADYSMGGLVITFSPAEIVSKIAQWKSDHEKKEPEIETVDICRIIEVLQDKKRVVHDEPLTGTYGSTKEEEAQEILKQYISEHEGNYIAVVEHVLRVKAVE